MILSQFQTAKLGTLLHGILRLVSGCCYTAAGDWRLREKSGTAETVTVRANSLMIVRLSTHQNRSLRWRSASILRRDALLSSPGFGRLRAQNDGIHWRFPLADGMTFYSAQVAVWMPFGSYSTIWFDYRGATSLLTDSARTGDFSVSAKCAPSLRNTRVFPTEFAGEKPLMCLG